MNQEKIVKLIKDNKEKIFAFSLSRTSNREDANDLSQNIIAEILYSYPLLKEDKAFYGWMWSIARNVYCKYLKDKNKKEKIRFDEKYIGSYYESPEIIITDNDQLNVLRREISLLSDKYRTATIMYYCYNKSCKNISIELNISVEMVKYLLFKSRKLLKEGMNMNREFGEKSYNPQNLTLLYWGSGPNDYYKLCKRKIPQNIILCCYGELLTLKQISTEIGIPVPYIEDEILPLLELGVLKQVNKNRYTTDIVIFTNEFDTQIHQKTKKHYIKIADIIYTAIIENEEKIRDIKFTNYDMNKNTFIWQLLSIILLEAITNKLQNTINLKYPLQKNNSHAFVWGAESIEDNWSFGISNSTNNLNDRIQFFDFSIFGQYRHFDFYNNKQRTNTLIKVAKNQIIETKDEKEHLAWLIQNNYVYKGDDKYYVSMLIFTKKQYYLELLSILNPIINKILDITKEFLPVIENILYQHTPSNLHKQIKSLSYLKIFNDSLSIPVKHLFDDGKIHLSKNDILTGYIQLNI